MVCVYSKGMLVEVSVGEEKFFGLFVDDFSKFTSALTKFILTYPHRPCPKLMFVTVSWFAQNHKLFVLEL